MSHKGGNNTDTQNTVPATQEKPKKQIPTNLIIFAITLVILIVAFFLLKGDVSASEFKQIEIGMTYDEVCDIIGAEGELSAEGGYGSYSNSIYSWKGTLYFINGGNAAITFSNGRVSAMACTGLWF